jgi:phenylpropionate dioxygenase-like ring-hydroxylating dioxygenase large terminal subunit
MVAASFAHASVVRQGWYLLAPSRSVRTTNVRSIDVGQRRIVVYRGFDGRAHVTHDRCPHLGSDLALGSVTREGVRCGYHGWCWGDDGACTAAPGNAVLPSRRLQHYAAEERWGFLWAWLGETPAFALPQINGTARHLLPLRRQHVRAHPDTAFANGFDLAHFQPSHRIEASTTSLDVDGEWKISHRLQGRLPRRARLVWAGLGGAPLDATFIQYGGGIVHVHIREPLEYFIVFTIRPDGDGHSRTQTILFLRRRRDIARALALLWATALDDIPLMETIAWTRGFAATDAVLERYVRFVEAMPTW